MISTLASPQLGLLHRFLEASGCHSSETGLMEAVPHLAESLSCSDSIATLRNLGLPLNFAEGRASDLGPADLPTLQIHADGTLRIILQRNGNRILAAGAGAGAGAGDLMPEWSPATTERAVFVRIEPHRREVGQGRADGIVEIVRGFRTTVGLLLVVSLMTNIMALATPLLIMAIYDRAIPTGSVELVGAMVVAMVIVFATDVALRMIRARAVAYMGAAVEGRLGMALFRKLTAIPLSEITKSDVDQQIARLRQFEGMRDLFAGPVFSTLLDLPFIFLFLGILFLISPAIGILILCAGLLFVLAAVLGLGPLERLNAQAAADRAAHQKFLFETAQRQRALQRLGLGQLWQDRHDHVARKAAESTRRARQTQLACQSFAQGLMAISGIGAIFLGTHLAMGSALSFGALIAIMTLVWKTLSPVQALYTNLPQIQGFLRSRRQIDRVLSLPEEFVRRAALSEFKSFKGALALKGVSHRFPFASEPSLTQVSLDIQPGECVAICGPNGSGKSVLFDLVDGLYAPTAGSLTFDGVSYRQIAVDDLRHMISYARQEPAFFHGTIWQNFQLAAPTLTRSDAMDAIEAMQLTDELERLPDGLDTRLSEAVRRNMSPATLRGLGLARCLCKPAAVYLLDDPAAGLDDLRRAALATWLARLRGRHTIVIVSQRDEHLRLADRFVFLDAGRVVMNDEGYAGQKKLSALLARYKG